MRISDWSSDVCSSDLLAATERIELQRHLLQTEALEQTRRQRDDFSVDVWPGHAVGLDAELMKLAIAAGLRTLVTEHRAGIPEPLLLVVQQAGFEAGAHARRRTFRPQRQAVASAKSGGRRV